MEFRAESKDDMRAANTPPITRLRMISGRFSRNKVGKNHIGMGDFLLQFRMLGVVGHESPGHPHRQKDETVAGDGVGQQGP